MSRRHAFLLLPALFAGGPSLAVQASAAETAIAPVAAATLPPELDRVLRDYERLWRTGDAAGLAAIFTPDGFVLQPGRPPIQGRAAIEAAYVSQASGDLRLRAHAFAFDDSVGFIVGGYRYGEATQDAGKFTLTLKRAHRGAWMIYSDMENGNSPPRRAAQPTTP